MFQVVHTDNAERKDGLESGGLLSIICARNNVLGPENAAPDPSDKILRSGLSVFAPTEIS